MIPSGVHQVDLSLKHAQIIGVGGEFTVVRARDAGSTAMALLIPVDGDTFEVVSNRIDLATDNGRPDGAPVPGHSWLTLTFNDAGGTVTADRGTVHDYDGDGIWTWHDAAFECDACEAAA